MNNNVQRYDNVGILAMRERFDGDYVLYSDYAKLEQRVKELEDKYRWIPVSEALPEYDGDYLCSDGLGSYKLMEFIGGLFIDHEAQTQHDEITHWRRIDAPEQ